MALIKCKECEKEVSDKAPYCPHCGIPLIENEKITPDESQKQTENMIKQSINKEKCNIFTIMIFILLSFSMYLTAISYGRENFYFIKTNYSTYTLLQAIENETMTLYIMLFIILIGIFTLISLIFTILSKKTYKFSKIGYILNNIVMVIFFINTYINNLRIGNQFIHIFIFNFILLILPRIDKLIVVETLIPKEKQDKIIKKNEKLEKLYTKSKPTLVKIVTIISVMLLSIISFVLILIFNTKDMKHYIQENDDDYNQIKIINNFINVREEPDSNSELLGKVGKNDVYNVLDKTGDDKYYWYKIEYKGEIAYIASEKKNPYVEELYSKDSVVKVNIFYSPKCGHCENALEYLSELKKQKYKFKLVKYNVEKYRSLFIEVADYFDQNYSVPLIVIEDEFILGFGESTKENIIKKIEKHPKEENNIVEKIKLGDLNK